MLTWHTAEAVLNSGTSIHIKVHAEEAQLGHAWYSFLSEILWMATRLSEQRLVQTQNGIWAVISQMRTRHVFGDGFKLVLGDVLAILG